MEQPSGDLEVSDLTVRFGAKAAVEGLSLTVGAGQVLAVLGPSGSGKSTLLRAIAGLERATTGSIRYAEQDLAGLPTHKRGFALMFQDGQLFAHQTVGRNVGYPLRLRKQSAAATAARVQELLELVGLPGYADRTPDSLSGGERQRVSLARALAVDPRLLLLDEPLSALDRGLRERLAAEIGEILHAGQTTALMVTHDHEEAFAMADQLAIMRDGRLVQHGSVEQVWAAPRDEWTARFLGYTRVLDPAQAKAFAQAAGVSPTADEQAKPWALRPTALRRASQGPVEARVVSARRTPEAVRLVLAVPGIGEVDAIADPGPLPGPGQALRLDLDETKTARLVSPRLGPIT